MVGFTGSRNLQRKYFGTVTDIVTHFQGQPLTTGCASGSDMAVRLAAGNAAASLRVFRASHQPKHLPYAARLVRRSIAMVKHVQKHAGVIVGFAGSPCPAGVTPRSSYFFGNGSGTWGSLAYAAHHRLPVVVVCCGQFTPPQAWPGSWQQITINGVACWQFAPVTVQPALF